MHEKNDSNPSIMIITTNNNNNSTSETNMNYEEEDNDYVMKSVEIEKETADSSTGTTTMDHHNKKEANNAQNHDNDNDDALVDPPSAPTNATSDDHSSTAGTSMSMSRASTPNSVESYTSDASSSSSSETSSALSLHEDNITVPVASLLPSYLEGFVQHSHDDFFVSPYFEPQLLAQLMCEGFLPISTSRYLLPKLHKERCVIYPLQPQQQQKSLKQAQNNETKPPVNTTTTSGITSIIHTSKSTKKKMKKFTLTINQDFDGVVRGCHNQHGVAWLYPKIVASFKYIHELSKSPTTTDHHSDNNNNNDDNNNTNNTANRKINNHQGRGIVAKLFSSQNHLLNQIKPSDDGCEVKLYSIEVWNQQTGELAAGELGYTIGTIYTSLTGFSSQDSAGSVQLAALGKILCLSGYEMWDLGMSLDYKIHLGASLMDRMDFIRCVRNLRVKHPSEVKADGKELKCDEQTNCKEIFDMEEWIQ